MCVCVCVCVAFRPPNMPWLYYFEEDADRVLTDTSLPTQFSFPDMPVPFKVATFTINGTFLGYNAVTNGRLQLCKDSQAKLDAAFVFGTTYSQEVSLAARTYLVCIQTLLN